MYSVPPLAFLFCGLVQKLAEEDLLLGPATGKQGAVGHERRHRLFAYAWCLYARDRSTDTCPLSSSCPAPLPSFLLYTPCDPHAFSNEQTTARRPSSCTKNLLQTEARVPYRAAQPRCPGFPAPLSSPGVVVVVWCAPLPCSYSDQQAAEFVAAGVYNKRRHTHWPK